MIAAVGGFEGGVAGLLDLADHLGRTVSGDVDPGEDAEQGGLADAVGPHDAQSGSRR